MELVVLTAASVPSAVLLHHDVAAELRCVAEAPAQVAGDPLPDDVVARSPGC